MNMKNGPLFLNAPISTSEHDVVGVETYVKKLDMALEEGAQMIAVTSPYGAGKSSVLRLLQKKRKEKRNWGYRLNHKKEHFVEIPMWSQLKGNRGDEYTNLHRSFVYQLANQINPNKGTYVNRRLNPNYGVLRFHANSRFYWLLAMTSFLLMALKLTLQTFQKEIEQYFGWMSGRAESLSTIVMFGAIISLMFVLIRVDVVFSSNKSEGKRIIEGDEIIDIYRTEILKPRLVRWKWWAKYIRKGVHYIVVIEDLDRTNQTDSVLQFLKELRKYYIPQVASNYYLNCVTFLINIKPESELIESGEEVLYAKIFDYILPLRTINVDNYDAILNGLLNEHKDEMTSLKLCAPENNSLSELPGMQWIIRERRLEMREIKERLNNAFSLYESLHEKFPDGEIAFEKCAAVAYLLTAFEGDFSKTTDRAFQKLVDEYLREPSEKAFEEVAGEYEKHLPGTSKEYQKAVWELIRAKLIDSSYRTYFYNYPKESNFYTPAETAVMTAILYDDSIPRIEQITLKLLETESTVIETAYQKRVQLGISLPDFVMEIEPLYISAVQICFDEVLKKIENQDYSAEANQKTLKYLEKIISFDSKREVIKKEHMERICMLLEKKMNEKSLLQLRKMLCEKHSIEICWYRIFFFGVHNIISIDEMENLQFQDAVDLLNLENESFSTEQIDCVVKRFVNLSSESQKDAQSQIEDFLRELMTIFDIELIAQYLLIFMSSIDEIIPDFEAAVGNYIIDNENQYKEEIFITYQNLINQIAPHGLGKDATNRISKIDRHKGFTAETAKELWINGFKIDAILICLVQEKEIDYENEDVIKSILKNEGWLLRNHPDLFNQLRLHIVKTRQKVVAQYKLLFGKNRPIMSNEEIHEFETQKICSELVVIELLSAENITQKEIDYLVRYFCGKKQTQATSMEIFSLVSQMSEDVAKDFFYELDFSKIAYREMNKGHRENAKKDLMHVLDLNKTECRLKFMKATKFLDTAWEEEMISDLNADKGLQEMYVEVVNLPVRISKNTIDILTSFKTYYGTKDSITEKAFQAKKYFWYVVSKILWNKNFTMEEGDRTEILWDTYLDVFKKACAYGVRNSGWKNIEQHMMENEKFLYTIMSKNEYQSFDNQCRMMLIGILQSSESILEASERGSQFAHEYYLAIKGFQDREAAASFVEVVSKNVVLLSSDKLYNHTHDLLVDGVLKAKYTNRRKRIKMQ